MDGVPAEFLRFGLSVGDDEAVLAGDMRFIVFRHKSHAVDIDRRVVRAESAQRVQKKQHLHVGEGFKGPVLGADAAGGPVQIPLEICLVHGGELRAFDNAGIIARVLGQIAPQIGQERRVLRVHAAQLGQDGTPHPDVLRRLIGRFILRQAAVQVHFLRRPADGAVTAVPALSQAAEIGPEQDGRTGQNPQPGFPIEQLLHSRGVFRAFQEVFPYAVKMRFTDGGGLGSRSKVRGVNHADEIIVRVSGQERRPVPRGEDGAFIAGSPVFVQKVLLPGAHGDPAGCPQPLQIGGDKFKRPGAGDENHHRRPGRQSPPEGRQDIAEVEDPVEIRGVEAAYGVFPEEVDIVIRFPVDVVHQLAELLLRLVGPEIVHDRRFFEKGKVPLFRQLIGNQGVLVEISPGVLRVVGRRVRQGAVGIAQVCEALGKAQLVFLDHRVEGGIVGHGFPEILEFSGVQHPGTDGNEKALHMPCCVKPAFVELFVVNCESPEVQGPAVHFGENVPHGVKGADGRVVGQHQLVVFPDLLPAQEGAEGVLKAPGVEANVFPQENMIRVLPQDILPPDNGFHVADHRQGGDAGPQLFQKMPDVAVYDPLIVVNQVNPKTLHPNDSFRLV